MDNLQIVQGFYDAFRDGVLTENHFTEDFHFTGVIRGFDDMDRQTFVRAFNQIAPLVQEHRLNDVVAEKERVFVSLDFISHPAEVKDTRFADLFFLRDCKISRLITHFDPRAFFVLPEFQED